MQKVINKFTKGFTLIELLVVIAIIGILAGIVLASLGTARSKGNDAKIQEQLKNIQSAAEIYYSGTNNYGTTAACGTMIADVPSGMASLVAASTWPASVAPTFQCAVSNGVATAFLAYHVLSSSATLYWCVDSNGVSKQEAAAPAAGVTACP